MFVGLARFDFVGEIPLMPFRVLRPIPAMAVERIFEFFENLRSRFLGACKMVTCIVHFDVENLRASPSFFGFLYLGPGYPIMMRSSPSFIAA